MLQLSLFADLLGAPAPVLPHDAHAHAVAVQHRAHLVGGQIDVGVAIVAQHETVPVAVALHRAFNFFQQAAGGVEIFDLES